MSGRVYTVTLVSQFIARGGVSLGYSVGRCRGVKLACSSRLHKSVQT